MSKKKCNMIIGMLMMNMNGAARRNMNAGKKNGTQNKKGIDRKKKGKKRGPRLPKCFPKWCGQREEP